MRLDHVFVDSFPEPLEEGKVYVSMRYASVAHLCGCGCGNEVVTPIRKRGWKLMFDGESITLSPSIGNHNLDCESHYFIKENEIRWARQLSQEEIRAGRAENQQGGVLLNENVIEETNANETAEAVVPLFTTDQTKQPEPNKNAKPTPQWWKRFLFWR